MSQYTRKVNRDKENGSTYGVDPSGKKYIQRPNGQKYYEGTLSYERQKQLDKSKKGDKIPATGR